MRVVRPAGRARRRRARRRRDGRPRGCARGCRGRAGPPTVARASARSGSPMPATPGDAAVDRDEDWTEAVGDHRRRPRRRHVSGRRAASTCRRGADADVVAVEPAGDAPARRLRPRPRPCARRAAPRPGAAWKARATACDDSASSARANWSARSSPMPARDRGAALGERAGLVEQHGVDAAQALERVGVLDEDAGARRAHQRHRHRQRHGQAERARARRRRAARRRARARRGAALRPADATVAAASDEQHLHEAPGQRRRWSAAARACRDSASCTMASSAPTRVWAPAASTRTTRRAPRFVAPAFTASPSATASGAGLAGQHGVVERRAARRARRRRPARARRSGPRRGRRARAP